MSINFSEYQARCFADVICVADLEFAMKFDTNKTLVPSLPGEIRTQIENIQKVAGSKMNFSGRPKYFHEIEQALPIFRSKESFLKEMPMAKIADIVDAYAKEKLEQENSKTGLWEIISSVAERIFNLLRFRGFNTEAGWIKKVAEEIRTIPGHFLKKTIEKELMNQQMLLDLGINCADTEEKKQQIPIIQEVRGVWKNESDKSIWDREVFKKVGLSTKDIPCYPVKLKVKGNVDMEKMTAPVMKAIDDRNQPVLLFKVQENFPQQYIDGCASEIKDQDKKPKIWRINSYFDNWYGSTEEDLPKMTNVSMVVFQLNGTYEKDFFSRVVDLLKGKEVKDVRSNSWKLV